MRSGFEHTNAVYFIHLLIKIILIQYLTKSTKFEKLQIFVTAKRLMTDDAVCNGETFDEFVIFQI